MIRLIRSSTARRFAAAPGRRGCAAGRAAALFLVIGIGFATRRAAAQCYYTYTQVPNPPGNPPQFTAGKAINNLGHVAGRYSTGGDTARAFFWSPETGTYLLPFPPGINDMVAEGINDLDQVCGQMTGPTPPYWHGFFWDRASGAYSIIDLPPAATQIKILSINSANHAVVTAVNNINGANQLFIWQDGVLHPLVPDIDGTSTLGNAISESDVIAGYTYVGSSQHAFDWMEDSGVRWLIEPSGVQSTSVDDINNNGLIAGRGAGAGIEMGLIWTPGVLEMVPPPSSDTLAILAGVNDAGRCVGYYYPIHPLAIVWQSGTVTDLMSLTPNSPHFTSTAGINNGGQIIVGGGSGTGVLTPVWLPGDLTGDCRVTIDDLLLVLSNFGMPQGTFPRGDVDLDGEVRLADLAIVLAHWGE